MQTVTWEGVWAQACPLPTVPWDPGRAWRPRPRVHSRLGGRACLVVSGDVRGAVPRRGPAVPCLPMGRDRALVGVSSGLPEDHRKTAAADELLTGPSRDGRCPESGSARWALLLARKRRWEGTPAHPGASASASVVFSEQVWRRDQGSCLPSVSPADASSAGRLAWCPPAHCARLVFARRDSPPLPPGRPGAPACEAGASGLRYQQRRHGS